MCTLNQIGSIYEYTRIFINRLRVEFIHQHHLRFTLLTLVESTLVDLPQRIGIALNHKTPHPIYINNLVELHNEINMAILCHVLQDYVLFRDTV